MKNILIGVSVCVGLFLLVIGGFWLNDYYHTRISPSTPQAKAIDCPYDQPIKGNAQSGIYHMPGGQYYKQTRPERCFASEDEAKQAGYRRSQR